MAQTAKTAAGQFPYPWRGIGALVIFLLLAPPVQVAAAAFMEHDFIGGRRILFEIGAVIKERIIPFLLSGYAFYMPPVFFAALWAAWRPAHGLALTLGGAARRMVICGLACEMLYQSLAVLAGGRWRGDMLVAGFVQWVASALVCWLAARRFGLACPAAKAESGGEGR